MKPAIRSDALTNICGGNWSTGSMRRRRSSFSAQGWTPEDVCQQVLAPIEDGSLIRTAHADPNSIMCYQIPGTITKDGQPIIGGLDIDESDFQFMASIYPKPGAQAGAVVADASAGKQPDKPPVPP
jgi:hypothetical protein